MSKHKEDKFKKDMAYRMHRIKHFAKKHDWKLINDTSKKFEFQNKEKTTLIINYFALDIETCLIHPVWGYTKLLRKGKLTMKLVEAIFRNPRQHMPKKVKSEYVNQGFSIPPC